MSSCLITLKPCIQEGAFIFMDVRFCFDRLSVTAGSELFNMQLETVSIPGCAPDRLVVRDDAGDVPVAHRESTPYPYHLLHIDAQRETIGEVTFSYRVYPREIKPQDICGPYFDLRAEEGGANSAGISFLADVKEYQGDISLCWDMSLMPEGSEAVCSLGEGDIHFIGALETLRSSYYAFGQIKKLTDGPFGFYWLATPAFDIEAIAKYTKHLFAVMQRFFDDHDPNYRIFVRKDPFTTSGGTALHRSYMFGWNDTQPVSVSEKQNILAHEMVHNWPHLNDNPYGTTTWYSEGTAEFYSVMLPLRAGLVDLQATLSEIQKRTDAYFTNPTRHMENIAATRICWQDRRAQRVPYGRGFFFLANADVQIRKVTDGKKSLDDVVLDIIQKDRVGETLGNQVFLDVVRKISGLDLTAQHEAMCQGAHIAPLPGCFDGLFAFEEICVPEADTGKDAVSYAWHIAKEGSDR